MVRNRQRLAEDLQQGLALVQKGKLFALQDWITTGKRLRAGIPEDLDPQLLPAAVLSGFHSMVEQLLRAGGWSTADLAAALDVARSRKRYDIAELLVTHGAQAKQIDFQTACEELDLPSMERLLRAGTDPSRDNDFARALSRVKARPLLGFYRQFRGEFPALDDQAALALSEAVRQGQVRWTALLAWAGADPFRPVPCDLDSPFPVDPEDCTSAARQALWVSNPEIIKVLHLKPTPAQAVELLAQGAYHDNYDLFQTLLSAIPRDQINDTPRGSSAALESLVSRWAHRDLHTNIPDAKGDAETLKCVELLLDSGARWDPPPDSLRHARRHLNEHDGRYVAQLLRLLIYTPGAANIETLLDFCYTQTLRTKIAGADLPLSQELKELRKAHRTPTGAGATANTETAPEVAAVPRTPSLPPPVPVQQAPRPQAP